MASAVDLKTLRFVPLQQEHIAPILEIERRANGAPWSERSFQNEVDHVQGIFRVAFLDGKIVGYGGVWLVIDEAHITTVAVEESLRSNGIGRRIMVELLTLAKQQGMTCSTLEVRAGNASAIHLYESLGYVVAATRKNYYPDNKEDAVVMWLYNLTDWEPPRRASV